MKHYQTLPNTTKHFSKNQNQSVGSIFEFTDGNL